VFTTVPRSGYSFSPGCVQHQLPGPRIRWPGVQQGKRLGLRNAGDARSGSKRLGQGQGDDRQPDSARRWQRDPERSRAFPTLRC